MRKNRQLIVDKEKGDCMRACLTSMLGLPNNPKIIPLGGADEDWFNKSWKFLHRFGLELVYEKHACWRNGYWIGSVKSKNYKGVSHAIIMRDIKVWFDPSTKERYRSGENLLGKGVITGGHFLEVVDPSKLHKLEIFKNKIS